MTEILLNILLIVGILAAIIIVAGLLASVIQMYKWLKEPKE